MLDSCIRFEPALEPGALGTRPSSIQHRIIITLCLDKIRTFWSFCVQTLTSSTIRSRGPEMDVTMNIQISADPLWVVVYI